MLYGDPHVVSFDNSRRLRELGATEHTELWTQIIPTYREWNTFLGSGDFWIVRSEAISIQGRYGQRGWIYGVAVGGSFLQGHKFAVGSSDDSGSGWDGFLMTWDGSTVLESFPSEFSVDGLIRVRYVEDSFYQDSIDEFHEERDNWRSRTSLRLLELSLPQGVRITVALGTNVGSWTMRFMDVFITMPFQASGQDGHCGRAIGDFNLDWQGSAVATGESLLTGTMPALLSMKKGFISAASTECIEGEELEDNRGPCESVLAPSEFGMLFVEACVQDVCSGGQGILEHYEAFGRRVFHEYAAEAQGKQRCTFPAEPHGVGYFWDPRCRTTESLGCVADGVHDECRLCGGSGTYAVIQCPGTSDL